MQKIYDLLDEYFSNNYHVGISDDGFHEKSIERVYGNNKDSIEKVTKNMMLHLENPHSVGFIEVSKHLIENGRAISLDTPKKQFEAIGYYYSTDISKNIFKRKRLRYFLYFLFVVLNY